MDEQSFLAALQEITEELGQLALEATEPDDPLAFPEPRDADEIAAFNSQLDKIQNQVDAQYHSLLKTARRDYGAGYPDRVGAYLVEFLGKLEADPGYQSFSDAGKQQVANNLVDLKEL